MHIESASREDPGQRQQAMAHRRWEAATRSFVEFPREALKGTLVQRFEHIARLYADRVAIKTDERTLTYTELNQAANVLARAIVAARGEANEPVVILLEPSAAPPIAMLGGLKAGKIISVLDPTHPPARLNGLLEDLQARLIITNSANLALALELAHAPSATQSTIPIVNLDDLEAGLSTDNLDLPLTPDTLTSIVYTSGSTGQPKGIFQNHRLSLHALRQLTNLFRISPEDRLTQFFSYAFGMSSLAVYGALLNGGMILGHELAKYGFGDLPEWLTQNEATIVTLPTSVFRKMVENLPNADEQRFPKLRLLVTGGEAVTYADVALWKEHFAPDCILQQGYGSSEAGYVTLLYTDKASTVSKDAHFIGYPLEDLEVVLRDDDGSPVESGQVGEITVKTRYMSLGYWRKPELTKMVFHPDSDGSDKRVFFTGDLGRFRPDGGLEWVGRKDFQVKIRAHTVQPAETEMALLDTLRFKEVVVTAAPTKKGDQRLIAYLVTKSEPAPTTSELRAALAQKLPDFMIPAAFVYLDALPRNANRKVDRKALPLPGRARPALRAPFAAPVSDLETQIANIWCDLLELERVGIHDNFFELGGDSLSAVKMILEIEQVANQTIPLDYFQNATIATLAQWFESGRLPESSVAAAREISTDESRTQQVEAVLRSSNLKRLVRLATGQYFTNAVVRGVVQNRVKRLSYDQGLRWLAFIGQPTIAKRLFPKEYEIFRRVTTELGALSAATDEAFRVNVLGNLVWQDYRETHATLKSSPDGLVATSHSAPDLFWRSFAKRVDEANDQERGRLFEFSGLEYLYHALKQKRGTILVTYHSPAIAVSQAILQRYTGLGFMLTLSEEMAEQMAEREQTGTRSTWSARFALEGQRILNQGGVVQIANDMSYAEENSLRKTIGRRVYDLKTGFAELAISSGATVLPVYYTFEATGRVRMTILAPLKPPAHIADHTARVHSLLDQYVAFLEDTWRKLPQSMGWGTQQRYCSRPIAPVQVILPAL